jgi:flagellar hook protein FlgE
MADYANNPTTGTKPDFSVELNVIDSLGGSHKFAMSFLKSSANPNEWNAEIYAVPASDVSVAGRPGQVASGLVKFTQTGAIDLANSTLFGAPGAAPTISLAASAGAAPAWATAQGVAASTVDFDLSNLTQYAAASTVNSVNSNGASVGSVVGVDVGGRRHRLGGVRQRPGPEDLKDRTGDLSERRRPERRSAATPT